MQIVEQEMAEQQRVDNQVIKDIKKKNEKDKVQIIKSDYLEILFGKYYFQQNDDGTSKLLPGIAVNTMEEQTPEQTLRFSAGSWSFNGQYKSFKGWLDASEELLLRKFHSVINARRKDGVVVENPCFASTTEEGKIAITFYFDSFFTPPENQVIIKNRNKDILLTYHVTGSYWKKGTSANPVKIPTLKIAFYITNIVFLKD